MREHCCGRAGSVEGAQQGAETQGGWGVSQRVSPPARIPCNLHLRPSDTTHRGPISCHPAPPSYHKHRCLAVLQGRPRLLDGAHGEWQRCSSLDSQGLCHCLPPSLPPLPPVPPLTLRRATTTSSSRSSCSIWTGVRWWITVNRRSSRFFSLLRICDEKGQDRHKQGAGVRAWRQKVSDKGIPTLSHSWSQALSCSSPGDPVHAAHTRHAVHDGLGDGGADGVADHAGVNRHVGPKLLHECIIPHICCTALACLLRQAHGVQDLHGACSITP